MILLSVIIPLYNSEPYIKDTLNSVYNQGLDEDEFEVIVINDGSTDKGPQMVADIASKHNNLRLISQQNAGVAAARNKGITLAKGEYIHFLDADDLMNEGSYAMLKELMQQTPELIKFDSYSIKPVDKARQESGQLEVIYQGNVRSFVEKFHFPVSAVFFLILRDFLLSSGVKFENFKLGEDGLFCMNLLQHTDARIIACSNQLYVYILHEGSATHNNDKRHLRNVIENTFGLSTKIKELAKTGAYPPSYYDPNINSSAEVVATHLLRGNYDRQYIKSVINKMKDNEMLPLKRVSIATKLINFIFTTSLFVQAFSFIHRNFYSKLIKSHIS